MRVKTQNVKNVTGKKNVPASSKQPSVSSPSSKVKAAKSSMQIPSCTTCGTIITDDIKALQCDRCQATSMWKCADCLNLPHDMYDHLMSDPTCNLRWLCSACDSQVMDTSKSCHNLDKLDSLIMMVEKLLDRLANFDGKVKDKCDVSVIDQIDTRLNVLEQRLAKQKQELPDKIDALKSNVTSQLEEKIAKTCLLYTSPSPRD